MILCQVKSFHMYLVLVDYILRITTVPVMIAWSIACWLFFNHQSHTMCVHVCHVSIPEELIMESIYV